MQSVKTLATGLIDYAGLFPPTGFPMDRVVANFAEYAGSADEWMLARLVVPAGRLDEFESAAVGLLPTDPGATPWRLSVLLPPAGDPALDPAVQRAVAFNEHHAQADAGLAVIDAAELRGDDPAAIDASVGAIPEEIRVFVELPHHDDPRGLIAAVHSSDASAKIRCGGVTPELIPEPSDVARFIHACAASRTPFKATAGLHHPLRSEQNLTYEPGSPRGVMHGFLNVTLAAACAMRDESLTPDDLERILTATDTASFGIGETGAVVLGTELSNEHLAACREHLFISIGSCSFDEPRGDLRDLGLL